MSSDRSCAFVYVLTLRNETGSVSPTLDLTLSRLEFVTPLPPRCSKIPVFLLVEIRLHYHKARIWLALALYAVNSILPHWVLCFNQSFSSGPSRVIACQHVVSIRPHRRPKLGKYIRLFWLLVVPYESFLFMLFYIQSILMVDSRLMSRHSFFRLWDIGPIIRQ